MIEGSVVPWSRFCRITESCPPAVGSHKGKNQMSRDARESQAKILVIDDDEDFRFILSRTLEKEGYRVQAVGTGAEALEALKSQRLDLALVDIKMPEMGGRETVMEIRKLDPQLPVLLVTGSPGCNDRELRAAAQGWIYKPFRLAQLRSMVRKLLEGEEKPSQ